MKKLSDVDWNQAAKSLNRHFGTRLTPERARTLFEEARDMAVERVRAQYGSDDKATKTSGNNRDFYGRVNKRKEETHDQEDEYHRDFYGRRTRSI